LDGQQRITSVFSVFETDLHKVEGSEWVDIYFDFRAEPDVQDSQFLALPAPDVDYDRYFPISTVFNGGAYRAATERVPAQFIAAIDNMYEIFKEIQIPVQQFETEDRTRVAIVFERINRQGVELDTLQLLTAWTWSEEFDLQNKFAELRESLTDYGFSEVGDDTNLVLRCCAAVLQGDPSAKSLISLNGAEVRQQFARVGNGIRGAIDFLRSQLHVESLRNLPFPTLLVPLSVFFAEPSGKEVNYSADTYRTIKRWFWRACFSGRYTGQTLRAAQIDIEEMVKLKTGELSSLGDFSHFIDDLFFVDNKFRISSANTKTFVLLLAQARPRTFLSGAEIDLGPVLQNYNRSEFHHLYPRAYLRRLGIEENDINSLANFCFLSRADNNFIGSLAPSEYRAYIWRKGEDEILKHSICPPSLFDDNFEYFLQERSAMLRMAAEDLMESKGAESEVG
jgi:hypothetical protein